MKVVTYKHHEKLVYVKKHNQGEHRENCLCYACKKFAPDIPENNCPIADAVYQNCVKFNIVSPVWECPEFVHA